MWQLNPIWRILLKSDAEVLDEVMVVAYGTTKKASFTGSAEVIKSDKLKERPIANVSKALDGMVAGGSNNFWIRTAWLGC